MKAKKLIGCLCVLALCATAMGQGAWRGWSIARFIGCPDTPTTYTGQAGKFLRVNAGATAVEFTTLAAGGDPLANWNIGAYTFTAKNYVSNAATGTSPYACTSETLNEHFNADFLDGEHSSAFLGVDGADTLSSDWDAGNHVITAKNFISDVAIGTSPYACTSTTLNEHLNADLLDGKSEDDFMEECTDLFTVGESQEYSTINAALAAASSGDTVKVYSGIYDEALAVVDGVNIVGVDRDTCILAYSTSGGGGNYAIRITSAQQGCSFTISNMTLSNTHTDGGDVIHFVACTVTGTQRYVDCLIDSNAHGVHFHGDGRVTTGSVTFTDCDITGNFGVCVSDTTGGTDPVFERCTIRTKTGGALGVGVWQQGAQGVTLNHCRILCESTVDVDAGAVNVTGTGTVTLKNCVLSATNSTNADDIYGIEMTAAGVVVAENCAISAYAAGGTENAYAVSASNGTLNARNCVVSATGGGGGNEYAWNRSGGTVNVYDSVIAAGTVNGTIVYEPMQYAQQFTSTVATSTAPFVVASSTKNTNLHADLLDSYEGSVAATNLCVIEYSGTSSLTLRQLSASDNIFCFVCPSGLTNGATIVNVGILTEDSQATSDTDYWSFDAVKIAYADQGETSIGSKTTETTGGAAITAKKVWWLGTGGDDLLTNDGLELQITKVVDGGDDPTNLDGFTVLVEWYPKP